MVKHNNGTLNKIPFVWKSWVGYAEVIGSGVFNLLGQNLMTISNQYENPSLVSLLAYISVAYNFGLDKYMF